MNLCEEVEQLCAVPRKVSQDKAEELRSHYDNCKACRRRIRFRLMAGKLVEQVFHGHRVKPYADLEKLDRRVDPWDQRGTTRSRHKKVRR